MSLISLLVPSRRPEQLFDLITNLEETVHDYDAIELVVKVDEDLEGFAERLQKISRSAPFRIRVVVSARLGGIFTLWSGIEEMFEASSVDSYFVMLLTDEARFLNNKWDQKLLKYIDFFPDGLFRLRISRFKYVKYTDSFFCNIQPESFAIYTRKWLFLTEGITNFCYAADIYQEGITYQLALGLQSYQDLWHEGALFRDVPIHDFPIGGLEFGQNIPAGEGELRSLYGRREWLRLLSYKQQAHMTYLARRLYLYVWAYENNVDNFRLSLDKARSKVSIEEVSNGRVLKTVSYSPSRGAVFHQNCRVRALLLPTVIREIVEKLIVLLGASRLSVDFRERVTTAASKTYIGRFRMVIYCLVVLVEASLLPFGKWRDKAPAGLQRKKMFNVTGLYRILAETGYPWPKRSHIISAKEQNIERKLKYRNLTFSIK